MLPAGRPGPKTGLEDMTGPGTPESYGLGMKVNLGEDLALLLVLLLVSG